MVGNSSVFVTAFKVCVKYWMISGTPAGGTLDTGFVEGKDDATGEEGGGDEVTVDVALPPGLAVWGEVVVQEVVHKLVTFGGPSATT